MHKTSVLEKIEKEMSRLTVREQLKLMERLAHKLVKTGLPARKELDWAKLYGLGKGLWNGEDAQRHVNRLREDRA